MIATERRLRLIACEVLARELCAAAASAPRIVDAEFLTQGLHDLASGAMAARLQSSIDRADADLYDGICLGFALCNNGIVGVRARSIPVVVPRAHDCITLLLGSRARYDELFRQEPGTFFRSAGWWERDRVNLETVPRDDLAAPGLDLEGGWTGPAGRDLSEEEVAFLRDCFGSWRRNYRRAVFIDTGVGDAAAYRAATRREAEENGWTYAEAPGDLSLLHDLLAGPPWDPDRFLILQPGQEIAADPAGCGVFDARPASEG
ncbi:MAG: DUF1638 domain-containing protein [Planctomycetes bacterium]|nr:DUF1638 domain-containing protein [Planctomycetota bacterium]